MIPFGRFFRANVAAALAVALLSPIGARAASPPGSSSASSYVYQWAAPQLNDKTYKKWVQFIRPGATDSAWLKVNWRGHFWSAVQEARKLQRPILFLANHGHLLGARNSTSVNGVDGRMTVWSDDEVRKLASHFVCVADEVWHIASGKDPGSAFFKKAGGDRTAGRAHGLYAMTPDGQGLGFRFIGRPKSRVLKLLKSALQQWNQIARQKGYAPQPIPQVGARQVWKTRAAEAGLLLHAYSRDLPRGSDQHPGDGAFQKRAWNMTLVTLTSEEARGFLPKGAKSKVPDAIVRRIAEKHLVDNVRGNERGWRSTSVQKAWLTTEAVRLHKGLLTVQLEGEASMEEGTKGYDPKVHGRQLSLAGDHRIAQQGLAGYDCKLFGQAVFDTRINKFVFFELVASGLRRGGRIYNGRKANDLQPAPMGVAFIMEGQYDKPLPAIATASKRKRTAASRRTRTAVKPRPKAPTKTKKASPDVLAAKDRELRTRVAASIQDGKRPRFYFSQFRCRARILALDDSGSMTVAFKGVSLSAQWSKLTLKDRSSIARAVLRDGVAEDHGLVAFYYLVAGETDKAESYLTKAGAAAEEILSFFQ